MTFIIVGDHRTEFEQLQRALERIGLKDWSKTLFTWIERYRGLEQIADDAMTPPVIQLIEYVESLDCNLADEKFAAELACLPFLDWRIRRDNETEVWKPERETLNSFLQRGITVWQFENTPLQRSTIATALLAQKRLMLH